MKGCSNLGECPLVLSQGSTFVRVMSKIKQPIQSFTEPFIDDFAVHSYSWDEHLSHLKKFFEVIMKLGLMLNLDKSCFAKNKVPFLGHVIGLGKISPDPLKCSLKSSVQYIKRTLNDCLAILGPLYPAWHKPPML